MRSLLHKVTTLLCGLMAAGAASSMAAPGAARLNHLKASGSPYLQRASQELVDWYPWGGEAFKKAEVLDRPILLDLGAGGVHIVRRWIERVTASPSSRNLLMTSL